MASTRKSPSIRARHAWTRPDVFADLPGALVRGARNYHRLQQLAWRGKHNLYEETITNLLVAEMAGTAYEVEASCPRCGQHTGCPSWCGSGPTNTTIKMRPLTKTAEGGNTLLKRRGAHADIVLAFASFDPDSRREAAAATETRLLIQCKRVTPGKVFNPDINQYNKLVRNDWRYGAVAYYGLYVQQSNAHSSAPTQCEVHTAACDRSVVLVPAEGNKRSPYYLPGKSVEAVLALGLPLRCLGGCASVGTKRSANVSTAALAFVRAGFPRYEPATAYTPVPEGAPIVAVNSARGKPGVGSPNAQRSGAGSPRPHDGNFVIVRLGKQMTIEGEDRTVSGYDPGMSSTALRNAARMYWRCDPDRAAALDYLVAAHAGQAIRAYRIAADGVTVTTPNAGKRRVAFELEEIPDNLQTGLLVRANHALAKLQQGASNPVHYVER